MRKVVYLQALLILIVCQASAQKRRDTVAIINEFNKVMEFSVNPYLHYRGIISLRSGPMVDSTAGSKTLHNEFYKVQDDLYYGNELEEVFLQDSLMVRINHSRKSVQVSKLDMASKKQVDLMPLKRTEMQRMLREHCTLSRLPVSGDTGRIMIATRETRSSQGFVSSDLLVVYLRDTHLPLGMEMTIHLRNEETEQMRELFAGNGFDVSRMESESGGKKSLSVTQRAAVSFEKIETTEEEAEKMPLWTEYVSYDQETKIYSGKGRCEGYEVTNTF